MLIDRSVPRRTPQGGSEHGGCKSLVPLVIAVDGRRQQGAGARRPLQMLGALLMERRRQSVLCWGQAHRQRNCAVHMAHHWLSFVVCRPGAQPRSFGLPRAAGWAASTAGEWHRCHQARRGALALGQRLLRSASLSGREPVTRVRATARLRAGGRAMSRTPARAARACAAGVLVRQSTPRLSEILGACNFCGQY